MKKTILFISFLVFNFSLSFGQAYYIYTVAGNGTVGFSGDGGPATAAELNYPYGIATDGFGNIYIPDRNNNRIRKVNTSGIITTIAGNGATGFSGDGGAATAAELNYPIGVWVDGNGNVFISDHNNNRVRVVNTNGIITTVAGNGSQGFSGDGGPATAAEMYWPGGVVTDASGNVYIADHINQRVRIVNTSGIISTYAGISASGFSGDGGPATAAEMYYPAGLALDNTGNLFIADQNNDRIREVNTSGIITTIAGIGVTGFSGDGGAVTAAELYIPPGVAVDASGDTFIADQTNARVREVNFSGIINTIAGNGVYGFSGDGGAATAAELGYPTGVALDGSGNIYFADGNNNRIRVLTLTPLGTPELSSSNSVNLYPNPSSSGKITIELSSVGNKSTVEIYNILGEKIKSAELKNKNNLLDLSWQPKGIYLYRILTQYGSLIASGKLVIE